MKITLWLVGIDADHAEGSLPYHSPESAEECARDNPGFAVFTVTATIDFSTIEKL